MGEVTAIDEHGGREPRRVPADLPAERSLLSAMLMDVQARRTAGALVTMADFYRPAHGQLFDAILSVHGSGSEHGMVDLRTVFDVMRRRGHLDSIGGEAGLAAIVADMGIPSRVARYARIITDMAALRRLIATSSDVMAGAYELPEDVGAYIDAAATAFASIELPDVDPPNVVTFDDFVGTEIEQPDWIIPHLIERGDRVIVIAGEGMGKGMLMRQIAVAVGQGVNPFFTTTRIPPMRTLTVDLENPRAIIRKTVDKILGQAIQQVTSDYDPDRVKVWHEQGGIDIRSRADFARFDAACAFARPDLVCVGPLYKLFRKRPGESDEDAALDVTARLDDLRTRHGFALFIEHHAPKGGGGGHREMTPFGSAVWLRWPEFGPALYPHPKAPPGSRRHLLWSHWRGPRDVRPWPVEMQWGDKWPWTFTFDDDDKHAHNGDMEMF